MVTGVGVEEQRAGRERRWRKARWADGGKARWGRRRTRQVRCCRRYTGGAGAIGEERRRGRCDGAAAACSAHGGVVERRIVGESSVLGRDDVCCARERERESERASVLQGAHA